MASLSHDTPLRHENEVDERTRIIKQQENKQQQQEENKQQREENKHDHKRRDRHHTGGEQTQIYRNECKEKEEDHFRERKK